MSASYQRFLDFFELVGTARLDGLDPSYFEPMTADDRARAYEFLMARVQKGGTDESVKGLFLADERRAVVDAGELLEAGLLRPDAELLAAWHIYRVTKDVTKVAYFPKHMTDAKAELRGNAAYWAPASAPTHSLVKGLRGMVLTETERLPRIHAVNKLLEVHGVTKENTDRKEYSLYYRGLWSDDSAVINATIASLDRNRPLTYLDN
ncbi:hypothetical protein LRH25_04655 [Ideonella azotifigens]|uniref:Uncharacterized protein n=1 Tax=Ideonella azotifigens TaxID=513160 RepID=A0ABN1KIP7_9BURK|nr:hypothetical protein [Ideonella azotifigens]MCD2339629.1 hypothetical protein [Ideonella azotifigens]